MWKAASIFVGARRCQPLLMGCPASLTWGGEGLTPRANMPADVLKRVGKLKNPMNLAARAARMGAVVGLISALAACGGGGGGAPAAPAARVPGDVAASSWFSQRLGINSSSIIPGATTHPVGGEAPFALWVAWENGVTTFSQTVVSSTARGFSTTAHQTQLPAEASSNATHGVVSGNWSLTAWTSSDPTALGVRNLWVRFKGPGVDSLAVQIDPDFSGDARSVRLVLDETGNARVFWDSTSQGLRGVNGRFVGKVWTPLATLNRSVTYPSKALMAPDGQGWLFETIDNGGVNERWFSRLTAAGGLGVATRLDEPSHGAIDAASSLLAYPEGKDGFTVAGLQQVPQASDTCLSVRRFAAGKLEAAQCIKVSGDVLPNTGYGDLAADATGHAVMAWSAGANDRAIYAVRRNAAGAWSAPAKLADVTPASGVFSLLGGIKVAVSPAGQALVVFGARANLQSVLTLRALTAPAGGAWPVPTELAASGSFNRDVAIAFNAQGVPGILQLMGEASGTDSVTMSTWEGGSWATSYLRSGTHLAFINHVLLSIPRLAPQGAKGWLAFWDEGHGPGDSDGYREIWGAEYR